MISIALVEDDNELRGHLEDYFNSQEEFTCALSVDSAENLLWKLKKSGEPDLILMDIGLPGMSGIEAMKLLKDTYPDTEILMLTVYSEPRKIFEALCAGASGYLLKNAPFDELKDSIIELMQGGAPMSPIIARKVIDYFKPKKEVKESVLSDKEKEVVIALVDGLSYKQVADRLYISFETVRTHVKNIYKKLQVHSKAEIIRKSLRNEI